MLIWIMGKRVKNILLKLVSFVPTTSIITFNSYPDFGDNAYAIFLYLQNHSYSNKYKMVWLINEKEYVSIVNRLVDESGFDCIVVPKFSLKGLYYYIRCRYCFFTHGILESIPLHQHSDKMINMWHGMPLKKIGLVDDGKCMYNQDYMLANSDMFQRIMADCFGMNKERVLPIGMPRCDLLFAPTDYFEKNGIERSKYNKVGIWLPTYRHSIVKTEKRIDGTYTPGSISFLDEDSMVKLDNDLTRIGQLLLIKLHPMDKSQLYPFRTYKNIIIIKQKDFTSQLYPLLGACDYLLTDFSSVCVDFDICKKPMGFTIDDYDSYKESRGFIFDDLLSVLPGPILRNYHELLKFICAPYYKPSSLDLNKYYDNGASERLVNFLKL